MKRLALPLLLALMVMLTACAGAATAAVDGPISPSDRLATQVAPVETGATEAGSQLTRVDEQGAVVIAITPLNLDQTADILEFNVLMDTHSVDLSMDLAPLATLTTDTGVTLQASLWDAPRGGHHVSGRLIFPSTADGRSVLEGAGMLTLTIVNLDAAVRTFEWKLD